MKSALVGLSVLTLTGCYSLTATLFACEDGGCPTDSGAVGGGGGGAATGGGGGAATGGGGGAATGRFTFVIVDAGIPLEAIKGLGASGMTSWILEGDRLRNATGGAAYAEVTTGASSPTMLAVAGNVVVLAADNDLFTCPGNCQAGGFTRHFSVSVFGLCSDPNGVWSVAEFLDGGSLLSFNGLSWDDLGPSGLTSPRGCWVDSDRAVWVTGFGGAARYFMGGRISASAGLAKVFTGGASDDGGVWLISYDTIVRIPNDGGTPTQQAVPSGFVPVAIGGPPDALVIVGQVGTSQVSALYLLDGGWVADGVRMPYADLVAIQMVSPNEMLIGGSYPNNGPGVLVRGTR